MLLIFYMLLRWGGMQEATYTYSKGRVDMYVVVVVYIYVILKWMTNY